MYIKSIGCQYFQRFGSWNEIEFPKNKNIIGIVGQYDDNPNKSNRSGKSTFVEMILYALFGRGRTRNESDLINFNYDKDMLVKIVLEDDGKEIVIERGKNTDSTSVLNVTGFEGLNKTDIQNEINKLLGIEYKDFIMTYFFLQNDIHSFMESNSSSKKEYIVKWLEKDYWKELENAAKERLNKITAKIKADESYLENIEYVDIEELKNELEKLESNEKLLSNKIKKLEKEKDDIQSQLSKLDNPLDLKIELKRLKKEVEDFKELLEIKLDKIENFDDDIKEKSKQYKKENIDNLINKLQENRIKIENLITEYRYKINDINSKINNIKKFKGVCPITHSSCNKISSEKEVKQLSNELKILNQKVNESSNKIVEIKNKISELKQIKSYLNNKEVEHEIKILKENIVKKEGEIEDLKNKIHNNYYDQLKSRLEDKIDEIDRVKKQLSNTILLIGSKKEQINNGKKNNKEIEKIKKEITNFKKIESYWKFITYMFSKNGIPSLIIEESLQVVQDETNIILEKLGATIRIEFTNFKQLKSWEDRCLVCGRLFKSREMECPECNSKRQKKTKDELILKIYEGDKETNFEQDSGGGKVLISVAIRLALMRLLIRKSNSKIKFVVLDEIFGMLDQVYRKSMLELIRDFVIKELNIDQVFIISHTEISDYIDDIILITRHDKYSTFSWL